MRWIIAHLRQQLKMYLLYAAALGKWLGVSLIIGTLSGLLGSAFHIGVEMATELRLANRWIVFSLPLLGILICFIYHIFRTEGESTNNILAEVQKGKGLHLLLLPSIFLATILTHLGGGSAGREGAALQMGGSLGFFVGKKIGLDDRDIRTATMAGMAAFFSALFGTPLAAAIFAMAVISVGLLYHAAFIPCFTASLTAYGISLLIGIEPTRFAVAAPALEPLMLLKVAVLASLCAFVSILFCYVLHFSEHLFRYNIKNVYYRAVVGGCVLILLTLLFSSGRYNGAGMNVITAAVENGEAYPWDFFVKILFTAVTLGSGYKGGEVVPSFFVGASFGCVVGPLLGIPAGFAAAIGLVAVFCGAVNCPIASIFLSIELFGAQGICYFAMACGLAYVLSGYSGIYSSQRILYDKLRARYIDVHTNAYHEGDATVASKRFR